jgi:radical SAM superfamily enzyme YgiQ (UPF0313 family)
VARIIDDELRLSLSTTDSLIPSVSRDMGNPPWASAQAHILILRLSPLDDVESSTSHLVLFSECRKALPGAYLDFGFFPSGRDRAALSGRNLPFFYGLESGRSPSDFDLVLVSNSFALELVNLPYLYSTAGMPMRASERAATGGDLPLVILGGSNANCAGALLCPGSGTEEASDCLVDGIFFGEGEGAIGELALALTRPGATRAERLAGAALGTELAGAAPGKGLTGASIDGLWIARSGKAASRRSLLPFPPPLARYPVLNSSGAATAKLQISAGCPGYCSFCLEGWEFRPYRELPIAEVTKAARELKTASGASVLEVYSYNFNAHSGVFELIFELNRIFRRVNFMSQRLDILADSPTVVASELAADKRSFTLGIEGISERMRSFFRKGIDSSQIDEAIAKLALPAVRELKLFYIIAGIEEEGDLVEFAESLARIAEARERGAPGLRILASAGYLVRLPFTPLQYAPLCLNRGKLEGIARRMGASCAAAGIEFRLAADFDEYLVDQLLALGGRTLAPWLERCPSEGRVYDGGLSRGSGASLEAFARKVRLLDDAFEAEKGEAWRPPLAFADENHGLLRKNYLQASAFTPKAGRLVLPRDSGAEGLRRLERLMDAKRRFDSIFVRITFPRELARATEAYRSSWAMRAVFAASPDSVLAVFDAEEGIFAKGGKLEGFAERYWGISAYRIVGPDSARLAKAAKAAGFEPIERIGSIERIDVELEIPGAFAREAEDALKAWLAEERVNFVERRATPESPAPERRLEAAPRDSKKGLLVSARLLGPRADRGPGSPFVIELSLGPKARLEPWLSRLSIPAAKALSLRIASIVGL